MTIVQNQVLIKTKRAANEIKPIFVTGCPRSGTTVVGECLGRARNTVSLGEPLFLRYFWMMYLDLHHGRTSSRQLPFADKPEEQMISLLGRMSDACYEALLNHHESQFVDHTPWNIAHIELIRAIYPAAPIIRMVRHPVAVSMSLSASYKSGRQWATDQPLHHARLWSKLNQCIEVSRYRTEILTIRYEDFCRDPELELGKAISHCRLEWSDEVLAPLAQSHASSHPASTARVLGTFRGNGLKIQPRIEPLKMEASKLAAHAIAEDFVACVRQQADGYGYVVS